MRCAVTEVTHYKAELLKALNDIEVALCAI